jgi:arabinogalactan oligomer/maltooligosaccharide transport system permease protein
MMKQKNIMEERGKYRIIVPMISLLTLLCYLLPFISWDAANIKLNGVSFLQDFLRSGLGQQTDGTGAYQYLYILLIIPIVLQLVSGLSTAITHKRSAYNLAAILTSISSLCYVIFLFSVAKKLNGLALADQFFMVKYLQAGFWFGLILNIVSIVASLKATKTTPTYIILVTLSVIWIAPIAWVIMTSFRAESGSYTPYFWPKNFTLDNYIQLFTDTKQFFFFRWFMNTLVVAICSCILTTFFVLSTAFTFSRLRFQSRKLYMNVLLVLGMFPGFMSMIAVYYILKGIGLTQSLGSLVLVYSGGAALSYYIAKGFFDTIPKALDEAAIIDGATKWDVFTKITMPLSKPIIIYTILMSFTAPWMDFIFAKVIMGDNYKNYTVALGLWTMLQREFITTWYTRFAAGAVIVSIPIAFLFIFMQKYYVEGLSGSVKG